MSYKNFNVKNPLVAVYATSTTGPTSSTSVQSPLDTSLHSGSVSSDTYTNDQNVSLFGDWYGSANTTGFLIFPYFEVDGVEQNQGIEYASEYTAPFRGNDVVFANAGANLDIDFFYKRGSATSWTLTSEAGYPRITGVTTQ